MGYGSEIHRFIKSHRSQLPEISHCLFWVGENSSLIMLGIMGFERKFEESQNTVPKQANIASATPRTAYQLAFAPKLNFRHV